MLTRHEAERLAQSIHALRPEWPVSSLLTFLKKRETRPLLDLTLELAHVAQLPDTKTPARIDEQGPWKQTRGTTTTAPPIRYATDTDCGICHGPQDGPHLDHDYRPPLPQSEWARPTPEQRELMRLAAEKAHQEKTAGAEAAE